MDDVAEKMRAGKAPYTAGRIGIELPQTLARRNEQCCAPPPRVVELCHLALPTSGPQKLRLRFISHKTSAQDICLADHDIYPLQSMPVFVTPARSRHCPGGKT